MELKGKNIAYVGGFGGIGLAVCKELVKKDIANLIVLDLKENQTALSELQRRNPKVQVHYHHYDVSKGLENARRVIESVMKKVSYIDILVNGAGIADESRQEELIQTNFAGLIHTTTAAIELWDTRNKGKGGLVINISSIAGLEPIKEIPVYCATKAGVIQFTRTIALQKEITGVKTFVVCPGYTATPIIKQLKAYLNVTDTDVFQSIIKETPQQTPEIFATKFVELMETAENGTIWSIIDGKITPVHMPSLLELPKELQ